MDLNPDPNTVSLHAYMERRFTDLERLIDTRFAAQETATSTALISAEKAVLKAENLAAARSAQQNEWRDTVNDLITTMMPRAEQAVTNKAITEKIAEVAACSVRDEGRHEGYGTIVPWAIASVSTVTAIVTLLVHL